MNRGNKRVETSKNFIPYKKVNLAVVFILLRSVDKKVKGKLSLVEKMCSLVVIAENFQIERKEMVICCMGKTHRITIRLDNLKGKKVARRDV